jgi:natural product biosynthesis luciferase-like monooxygenase protein
MYLSEKIAYRTALVTKAATLSVESLKSQIAAICYGLEKKNIRYNDTVFVMISDEMQLLPLAWALIRSGLNSIFYDLINGSDISSLVSSLEAKCIIAARCHTIDIINYEAIAIEDLISSEILSDKDPETIEQPFSWSFYNSDAQKLYALSSKEISGFYSKLDVAVNIETGDNILLSECLPFQRRLLEMIWASINGLTIIAERLDEHIPINRYKQDREILDMNFGLFYFGSYVEEAEKERYKLLFDTAKYADDHGFTSVWTPERHFNEFGGLYPNPSVISAALAVSTSRVQIRSGSLVAPLHHAARIAEDWSVVDNLSGGRAAISFASGWQCDDFIFFPENYSVRHEHMMLQLDEVRRLWEGQKVTFKNGLGNDVQVAIYPKPVQKKLPVWITVAGKVETFIDAGKIGANILTHLLWQNTDELIEKIAAYRKSLKENGFDPRSGIVSVMAHTYLGEDNETVKEKVRQPLKNYIRSSTQLIQAMVKSNDQTIAFKDKGRYGSVNGEIPEHLLDELTEIAFHRFFDHAGLLGTIEKVKEMIRKLKSYDVDEVACLTDFGLGRQDILQGLTYLNELRSFYDKTTRNSYPVSIVHCTQQSLLDAAANPELTGFLSAQQQIIVETQDFQEIPKSLLSKVLIINDADGAGIEQMVIKSFSFSEAELKTSFNALINDEF